jgi:hypothetical protein
MSLQLTTRETQLLRLWLDQAAGPGEAANAAMHLRRLLSERGVDAYAIEEILSRQYRAPQPVYQSPIKSRYAAVKLHFGKHRGRRLDQIPTDYLLWVLDNCKNIWPSTKQAIKSFLDV